MNQESIYYKFYLDNLRYLLLNKQEILKLKLLLYETMPGFGYITVIQQTWLWI